MFVFLRAPSGARKNRTPAQAELCVGDFTEILEVSDIMFGWLEGAELPLPIPNRVVKRSTADDTHLGKVGSRPYIVYEK